MLKITFLFVSLLFGLMAWWSFIHPGFPGIGLGIMYAAGSLLFLVLFAKSR